MKHIKNILNTSLYKKKSSFNAPLIGDDIHNHNYDGGSLLSDNLDSGRVSYDGTVFNSEESVVDDNGLLTNGSYTCSGVFSEDDTEWSGNGPWTITLTLTELTTYTLSTDVSGATVVVTAGTSTITTL